MLTGHSIHHCFDTDGWAMLPVIIGPKMTSYVSGGTLNLTS